MKFTRNQIDAIIVAMFGLTLTVGYSFPKLVELSKMEFSTGLILAGLIVVFAALISSEAADGDEYAIYIGAMFTIIGMFIGLLMAILIFVDFLLACLGLLVIWAYIIRSIEH